MDSLLIPWRWQALASLQQHSQRILIDGTCDMEGPGVCQVSETRAASNPALTARSSLTAFMVAASAPQCCGRAAVRVGPEDTCLDALGVGGDDLLSGAPPGMAPWGVALGRLLEALSFCWDGSCKHSIMRSILARRAIPQDGASHARAQLISSCLSSCANKAEHSPVPIWLMVQIERWTHDSWPLVHSP